MIDQRKTALAEALLAERADAEASLNAFRDASAERFRAIGAPVRRDEYWRFTDPAKITAPMPTASGQAATQRAADAFDAIDAFTLVFDNGRFRADLSDQPEIDGLTIDRLSEHDEPWIEDGLGKLERSGQEPVSRPFAALNGAMMTDGLAIRASTQIEKPIRIQHLGAGDAATYTRVLVVVDEGASLTVLESGFGAARQNTVLELGVETGGALHHIRLQTEARGDGSGQAATHIFGYVGAEASLKSFTLSGAAAKELIRNEYVVYMDGDDASAHLAGGVIAAETGLIDNTIFLTHDAERCESRQVFKNVAADDGRAVFQGKILVKEGAQKTDGYQISQSVLLSERASFQAKPELEIYADDVICSHGSTTGALDESQLFYLRARGMEETVAKRLLVLAFIEEAITEIADEALQDAVRGESERLIAKAAANT